MVYNKLSNYVTMVYNKVKSTSLPTTIETKQVEPESVREYDLIDLQDNCTNLILGSSIIAKLQTDNTIPSDIAIHPYRRSTTKEKIAIVEKYSERKMHSVVLQDATNSFLKFDRKPADVFESFKKLVNICLEKFNPDQFVICEVIPLTNLSQNATENGRIDEFNSMIHNHYGGNGDNIKILKLNQMIKMLKTTTRFIMVMYITSFGQVYRFSKQIISGSSTVLKWTHY